MVRVTDTSFSNEIHQLLVTMSRHLYLSRAGVIKYQEKPMEVNIENFHRSKKEHLVYYVLRDLFSGNFIFTVATTKEMIPLLEFLHFGWKKDKEEDHFWGLPERLSVPKRISSPGLLAGLQQLGVEPFHPSSGFTSGIRIIKDIEDNLCYFVLGRSAVHSLISIQRYKNRIYRYILEDTANNRIDLWNSKLKHSPEHPREVPDYQLFRDLFTSSEEQKTGLPLTGFPGGNALMKPKRLDLLNFPIESQKFSPEKLTQAQELLYAAYDVRYRDTVLQKAYLALRRSPYCADAYNLLAENSRYLDEKIALYRRAARAGELSLGELFFKRNEGHFWGIYDTRPYMRALYGLAETLWEKGQRGESLDIYRKMLRLNHSDNQGIRYLLGFRLLDEEHYNEMEKLYQTFEEPSCFMLYNRALSRFCSGAYNADKVLRQAMHANKHVSTYLLGEKKVPFRLPDHYSPGSEEEAVIYAGEAGTAWHKAAGALDWLKNNRSATRK